MEKETEKLYMNDMTQQKMYKLFGLQEVNQLAALTNWLSDLPELNKEERFIGTYYQNSLLMSK